MKDLKISDELISEILGKKVSMWGCDSIGGSVIEIGIHLPSGGRLYKQLNIYELTSKCKEWAEKKGYIIFSKNKECLIYSIDEVYDVIECLNQYEDYFESDTEVEAIIKACEFILIKKESK